MVITVNTRSSTLSTEVDDLLYEAWCVISNASDWPRNNVTPRQEQIEWERAAVRWRDKWHRFVEGKKVVD